MILCLSNVLVVSTGLDDSQARSRDLAQDGADVSRGPRYTPTKNGKLPGFGPLFFGRGPNSFARNKK